MQHAKSKPINCCNYGKPELNFFYYYYFFYNNLDALVQEQHALLQQLSNSHPPKKNYHFLEETSQEVNAVSPFFHSAKSRDRKWVFALAAVRNSKVFIPIAPAEFSSLLFCKLGCRCVRFISTATAFRPPVNNLVVPCRRSTRGALANSAVTVEPSRNRKQEVARNSCCLQLPKRRS